MRRAKGSRTSNGYQQNLKLGDPSNEINDWQTKCSSNLDRQKYLLQTGLLSDCKFQIGDSLDKSKNEIFNCHKLILSMASPVYERMFYGKLAESSEIIVVTDVDSSAFRILLKYIYTEEFDLSIYGFSKAAELHHVAEKYMVSGFLKLFFEFLLSKDWDIHYIFAIGRYANEIDEHRLKDEYCKQLKKAAKKMIMHETFMELDISDLPSVINIVNNNVSQFELFKAIEKYAEFKGLLNNVRNLNMTRAKSEEDSVVEKRFQDFIKLVEEGNENITSNLAPNATTEEIEKDEFAAKLIYIKDLVKLIRFDKITLAEFASAPANSDLLDSNDKISIFKKLSKPYQM